MRLPGEKAEHRDLGEANANPSESSPIYSLPLLFPSSLSLTTAEIPLLLLATCGQVCEHAPGWDQGGVLWSLLGGKVRSTGGKRLKL